MAAVFLHAAAGHCSETTRASSPAGLACLHIRLGDGLPGVHSKDAKQLPSQRLRRRVAESGSAIFDLASSVHYSFNPYYARDTRACCRMGIPARHDTDGQECPSYLGCGHQPALAVNRWSDSRPAKERKPAGPETNVLPSGCLAPGHSARQEVWRVDGPRLFSFRALNCGRLLIETHDSLPVRAIQEPN